MKKNVSILFASALFLTYSSPLYCSQLSVPKKYVPINKGLNTQPSASSSSSLSAVTTSASTTDQNASTISSKSASLPPLQAAPTSPSNKSSSSSSSAPTTGETSSSSTADSSSTNTVEDVELTHYALSRFMPKFFNWMNGTDKTLLACLKELKPGQKLKAGTTEAQNIIASSVHNFERRTKDAQDCNVKQTVLTDIRTFLTEAKEHDMKMDRTARVGLRTILDNIYASQLQDAIKTKQARDLTFQDTSDDEAEYTMHATDKTVIAKQRGTIITLQTEKALQEKIDQASQQK